MSVPEALADAQFAAAILHAAVNDAHRRATLANDNASAHAVRLAASCGVPFHQAVVAALSTLGAAHGPARQAREAIYVATDDHLEYQLQQGNRIPGWGNSFHKGSEGDPAWHAVRSVLQEHFLDHWERLLSITHLIVRVTGHWVAPNAAAYTAALAQIEGLPVGTELQILVSARISAWGEVYRDAYRPSRLMETG